MENDEEISLWIFSHLNFLLSMSKGKCFNLLLSTKKLHVTQIENCELEVEERFLKKDLNAVAPGDDIMKLR